MKKMLGLMTLMLCLTLVSAAAEGQMKMPVTLYEQDETEENSFLNSDGTANYFVRTVDKAGKGIEGVAVQICSDQLCRMLLTDEEGTVTMTAKPYIYEVHILEAEGYAEPDRTFLLPENGGVLLLELEAE